MKYMISQVILYTKNRTKGITYFPLLIFHSNKIATYSVQLKTGAEKFRPFLPKKCLDFDHQ